MNNMSETNLMIEPQDWTFPVHIAYGPGRLAEIGYQCQQLGISNPLIVTDKGSHHLPFIGDLQTYLSV
jgi:alcohol dehydrogenase class IV